MMKLIRIMPLRTAAFSLLLLKHSADGIQLSDAKDGTGEKATVQSGFWEVASLDEEKRFEMIVASQQLDRVEDSIDWEDMRDSYLIASFSNDVEDKRNEEIVDDYDKDDEAEERLDGVKGRRRLPRKRRDPRRRKYRHKSGKKKKKKNNYYYDYNPNPHTPPATMPVVAPSADPENPDSPTNPNPMNPDNPDPINPDNPDDDNAIRIPIYEYSRGDCPDSSAGGIPCAPDNLQQVCDKYTAGSSFRDCFELCKPSFCCIHDAPPSTNLLAPNCNTDVNCPGWTYCYIVWWKLHDTIGPAVKLQLEGNDDFFDVEAEEIDEDVTNNEFYREMLFHHFDDSNAVIDVGTVQFNSTYSFFNSDLIFLDPLYWPDGDGL